MQRTASTPCIEHTWERSLETHHKLERVVRVCTHCGHREICWEQPHARRARGREVFTVRPSGTPYGPGIGI